MFLDLILATRKQTLQTIMPLPGVCLNILEARQKQNGYGSPTNPDKFLNQDYEELKQYCNIRGVRYIDEMFPPDQASIGTGILNPSDLKRVEWLRPIVSCYFFSFFRRLNTRSRITLFKLLTCNMQIVV